jgi:hypothetical protein
MEINNSRVLITGGSSNRKRDSETIYCKGAKVVLQGEMKKTKKSS